jgi:hypothetical protein
MPVVKLFSDTQRNVEACVVTARTITRTADRLTVQTNAVVPAAALLTQSFEMSYA